MKNALDIRVCRLTACLLAISSAPVLAGTVTTNTLKVNGPSTDDLARTKTINGVVRLRKTQEAMTNEQSDVKLFPGSTKGLYVEMRTSDINGALPTDRMQAACSSFQLSQMADGSVSAQKLPGERFVTDNRGNDYRNANQPYLVPVAKNAILFTFNYQPQGQGDTKRYAKILDPNCNEVPITDASGKAQKQVLIMAKQNDDCSMNEDGGGADTRILPSGATRMVMWAGCNGNGEDKGWLNTVDVTCKADAAGNPTSCQIAKQFDVALCEREERSRGRCSMSSADPDTAVCTWTEGNNQPQRDGTWIGAVNVGVSGEQGESAQSRVLWKKLIEGKKTIPNQGNQAHSYSVRAKSARVMGLDSGGNIVNTDMLFVSTGDLIGDNQNNQKGGRYVDARLGVVQVSSTGPTWIIPMSSVLAQMVGMDYTHIKMTGVLAQNGNAVVPAVTFLQGSQNGGGVFAPDLKVFALDQTNAKFQDYGTFAATGASYDRHLYSNYLGGNPGVQGRNFAGATFVANPFVGTNGNTSKFLALHALTGKDPTDAAKAELKPSSYVAVTQLETSGPVAVPTTALNGSGGGQHALEFALPTGAIHLASLPAGSASHAGVANSCSALPLEGGNADWLLAAACLAFLVRRRVDGEKKKPTLSLERACAMTMALFMIGCGSVGGINPGTSAATPPTTGGGGGNGSGGGNGGGGGGGGNGGGNGGGGGGGGGGGSLSDGGIQAPDGGFQASSAEALFNQTVAPILSASCAASGCHSTAGATPIQFIPPAGQSLYVSVLGYADQLLGGNFNKADAQILTKIAGGHFATYTPADVSAISAWLDAEVAARGAGAPPPPSPARELMAQWSGCMNKTDWDADGVAVAWANKTSSEGACQQCHINGQGFLATQDSDRMFTILTTEANPTQPGNMFMQYYFIPDLTTNPANPKMVLNTTFIQNAGSGAVPQHPLFDINDGNALQKLETFYNQTVAHLDAGVCGSEQFTP